MLDTLGFEGVDTSLNISLIDYGGSKVINGFEYSLDIIKLVDILKTLLNKVEDKDNE